MNGIDRQSGNSRQYQPQGQPGYTPPPGSYPPPPPGYNQPGQYPRPDFNPPSSFRPPQPPGKSNLGVWIAVVSSLVIVIGAVVAGVVILGGKDTKTGPTQGPAATSVAGPGTSTPKPGSSATKSAGGSTGPVGGVPASLAGVASKYPVFNNALKGLNELGAYPGAEKIINKVFSRELEAKAENTLVDIDATGTEFFVANDEVTMLAFYLTPDSSQKVEDYYTNIFKSRNYFQSKSKKDSFGTTRFTGTDRSGFPTYEIAIYADTFQFPKDVVGDAQKVKGKSFFEIRATDYLKK